jgi:hypothetical protein
MVANARQVQSFLAGSYGPHWHDVWEEDSAVIRGLIQEHFGIKKSRQVDELIKEAHGMAMVRSGLSVAPPVDRYETKTTLPAPDGHYFRGYDGKAYRVDSFLRAIEASLGWNVPGVTVHALEAIYAHTLRRHSGDWTRPETERYAAILPADLRAKMTERWGTECFLDRLRILEPIVVMDEVLSRVSQSLGFSPSQISSWIDHHVTATALTPLMRLNTAMALYERVKLIEAQNPERLLKKLGTLDFLEAFDQRLIVQIAGEQTQRMASYIAATRRRAEKVREILMADPVASRPPQEATQVVERMASAGYFKPRYPFGKPWEGSAWRHSARERSAQECSGRHTQASNTVLDVAEMEANPEMGSPLEIGLGTFAMVKVGA